MSKCALERSGSPVTAVKFLIAMALACASPVWCQQAGTARPAESDSKDSKILDKVFDYLNVANQGRVREFHPLTHKERNSMFAESLINPVWYLKGAASAGVNQWTDTPKEWEQGVSGYGKRFGDIMGQ